MNGISRRAWCCGLACLVWPIKVFAVESEQRRMAHLVCAKTEERFDDVYWENGQYLPDAMSRISWLLRDIHHDSVTDIDPSLIDLLWSIADRARTEHPFTIMSGYRSPKTNSEIRNEGYPSADHSMHLFGKAVDIQLPGMSTAKLSHIARSLKGGGVGRYPGASIIHVDTGPVREWTIPVAASE